jgi:uncharacterized protein YcnI
VGGGEKQRSIHGQALRILAFAAGGVVLFTMPLAFAHVTVAPKEAPAGATQRYCIRVPSEKSVPTVGLEAEFPPGLEVSAIEAPTGWNGTARKDRQGRIVSASWDGGSIPPGHALEFGVVARNPQTPATLTWKAIQKYKDASEVHWIGSPQAQFPAAITRVQRSARAASGVVCSQEATPSSGAH